MQKRTDLFLGLSAVLTGFSRLELLGTDMVSEYLRTIDEVLPPGLLDELLAVYERLPTGDGREAAVASQILNDRKMGPVAQNLILLWYRGAWAALPDSWRTVYGASPLDTNRVISAQSYQAGLQWVAAGGHPPGAQQQGFGAWSRAPERNRP
jgi:hypothetical protein